MVGQKLTNIPCVVLSTGKVASIEWFGRLAPAKGRDWKNVNAFSELYLCTSINRNKTVYNEFEREYGNPLRHKSINIPTYTHIHTTFDPYALIKIEIHQILNVGFEISTHMHTNV